MRIPKSFSDEVGLQDGSVVDLRLVTAGVLIAPAPAQPYGLDELMAAVTEANRPAAVDTGPAQARLRRVFRRITFLWAVVFLVLASLSWYLLSHSGIAAFVGYRTAISAVVKALAIAASVYLFRSGLRRQGIRVAFGAAA